MPGWVLLGCDSDNNGALAVIRGPLVGFVHSIEVHDCPMKEVTVNSTPRLRQDVDAMARLVRGLDLPEDTVVYLEEGGPRTGYKPQSAYVQGGNCGRWEGVFASQGLIVRMIPARTWKCALKLAGKHSTKDDSLMLARAVFPELDAEVLKLQKHHGRAEALIIAAYGHRAYTGAEKEDLLSMHLALMVESVTTRKSVTRKRKRRTSTADLIEATSHVGPGPSTM